MLYSFLLRKDGGFLLRHSGRPHHLTPHPHHRQHLQQALREGEDQEPDPEKEEVGRLDGLQEDWFPEGGMQPKHLLLRCHAGM